MLSNMDHVAEDRFQDALNIQLGASNASGVARSLVRAINACHQENVYAREDPAVRLIVHQLAHLCGIYEIDTASDVYNVLTCACEQGSAALQAAKRTPSPPPDPQPSLAAR